MNTQTQVRIPIQSIIDLITNSSKEIYVTASTRTITGMKSLLNSLLKGVGSSYTADDLYEITLSNPYRYDAEEDEEEALQNAIDEAREDELFFNEAEIRKNWVWDGYHGNDARMDVIIRTKSDNKDLIMAANILADITSLFDIEETYN